jgi:hypothetical protein
MPRGGDSARASFWLRHRAPSLIRCRSPDKPLLGYGDGGLLRAHVSRLRLAQGPLCVRSDALADGVENILLPFTAGAGNDRAMGSVRCAQPEGRGDTNIAGGTVYGGRSRQTPAMGALPA